MNFSRFGFSLLTTVLLCLMAPASLMFAETSATSGAEAWLRYVPPGPQSAKLYAGLPGTIVRLGDSEVVRSAQQELALGVGQISGRTLRVGTRLAGESAIVLGSLTAVHGLAPELNPPQELFTDGYWLKSARIRGQRSLVVAGASDRGILYGVFALLRKMAGAEGPGAFNLDTMD